MKEFKYVVTDPEGIHASSGRRTGETCKIFRIISDDRKRRKES